MATTYIAPTWRMPTNSNNYNSPTSNYSLELDGSAEYMTIPSTNFGDGSTNVSYSLWLNPDMPGGSSNYGYLLSGASASDGGLAMNEGGTGAGGVNGTFYYYNGAAVSVLTSTALTAGNWAHLVFIFDASANEVYAYINGSLDKTTSVTSPFKTTFTTLFRYTPATAHYYDGQVGDICIYNYAITSSQVTALYNSGIAANPLTIAGVKPKQWWQFGTNSNPASNGAGFPNLSISGSQPYSSYSLNFNGTDERVSFGSASYLNGLSSFSLSVWFNIDTAAANDTIVADWNYNSDPFGHFAMDTLAGGAVRFYIKSAAGTGDAGANYADTGAVYTAGSWINLIYTFSSGTLVCYANGSATSLTTSGTFSSTLQSENGDLSVGYWPGSLGRYFNGKISNLAIWTGTVLSPSDATNIYNSGVTQDLNSFSSVPDVWYPLDASSVYYNQTNLSVRGETTGDAVGTGTNMIQENIFGNAPGTTSNASGTNITFTNLEHNMSNSSGNAISVNMEDYSSGSDPADSGRSTEIPS
jgi:hypothetical protein